MMLFACLLASGYERPGWAFWRHGGRPPLPFTSAMSGRIRDVTVGYFLGNATGFNNATEAAAEARFGIAGLGWQLDNVESNHSHVEAAELKTARTLKALNKDLRVLVSRNSAVVSTFWDVGRAAFEDASKDGYWVKTADGTIVETAWVSPAGNTPKRWINFTNPDAAQWWATAFVGPVLTAPEYDGFYLDCACESPPGVDKAAFGAVQASAQLAIDRMLPRFAAAGKWVSAWDGDGAVRASSCAADMRALLAKGAGYATLQVEFNQRDREQSLEMSAAGG